MSAAFRRQWAGVAVILAAAALATAPLIIRGTSCGNDFDFHLVSWIDCLHAWQHGIVYPHWAASPNFNAGEPRFVFYPPLEWMLGAALGAVLPWIAVPVVLVFLLVAGTGLAARALARQVMGDGPATLAGCLAIFSGYALFTVYTRSAYAELAAGVWIPLLLLLFLREHPSEPAYRRALDGVPALAIVIALVWLSNAPAGVIASYLLATVALARAIAARSWAPISRAAVAMVLGLALSAVYLVPAVAEQHWADLNQAVSDPGERIESNFLFEHRAGDAEMALHDAELARVSWIAVGMIGATLAGLAVCWRRRRLPGARNWWTPMALIPFAVLLLLLPISLPIWNALPKMRYLQFPWRWLVVLEAPLGVFVASAVNTRSRRWIAPAIFSAACVAMTFLAGRVYFTSCYAEDSIPGMLAAYRAGTGFEGTDEYSPEYADNSSLAMNLPDGCLAADAKQALGVADGDVQPQWTPEQGSCAETFPFAGGGNPEHWRIHGKAMRNGWLVLRLRAYPAWQVRLNGQPATDLARRVDGLIALPVAAGPLDVTVDWTATPDVWTGRALSALALVLVTACCAILHRRSRSQLS